MLFIFFKKFTGKQLCQSLFLNKVASLRPATLLKKRLWHKCFPVNFAKFLRTLFLTEHLRWLLLNSITYCTCPNFRRVNPAGNYMFKVNNRNTRTRCEICAKLTIKTPERRHYTDSTYKHLFTIYFSSNKIFFFLVTIK